MRYLLLIAALLCVACRHAAPPTITVKDTTFVIVPPIIRDSGTAKIVIDTLIRGYVGRDTLKLYDTLASYVKLKGRDTVIKWLYYPSNKTFTLMVKPDTLRFTYRDTVYKEARASPNSFTNELMLILAVLAILVLAIYIVLKK